MINAWEFGTAAAVAGWLLDSQTDRVVEELRRSRGASSGGGTDAPHPSTLLRGWPIDWSAPPLRRGDFLDRSRLAVTIAERLRGSGELQLETIPIPESVRAYGFDHLRLDPAALGFTVLVTPLVAQLPIWVMFETRPDSFSAARLMPVFDGPGPPGRAYCQVDHPEVAVNVIEWGLDRYQLALPDFRWGPVPLVE